MARLKQTRRARAPLDPTLDMVRRHIAGDERQRDVETLFRCEDAIRADPARPASYYAQGMTARRLGLSALATLRLRQFADLATYLSEEQRRVVDEVAALPPEDERLGRYEWIDLCLEENRPARSREAALAILRQYPEELEALRRLEVSCEREGDARAAAEARERIRKRL